MIMNNETEYVTDITYPPEIERYNNAKPPRKQPNWVPPLSWFLSSVFVGCVRKGCKVEKINMKGLKPPYILLINHLQILDFCVMFKNVFPHKLNIVASHHTYFHRLGLMEKLGCVDTRKHIADINLVRSCKKVLQEYKNIFCMFPEAGYTPIGTNGIIPDAVGKLVKRNNVPVVVMLQHGSYLNMPFWSSTTKHRKTPIKVELKQILTAEDIAQKSDDEINAIIRKEMEYDEYRWQKENNIKITENIRAEGLNKVLYQCPHCLTEGKMNTKGIHLFCEECGKKWEFTEDGELKALEGETEFPHMPDWYEWQRANVRQQILDGTYYFEEELDTYSLPGTKEYVYLGKANLVHSLETGFVLTGHYNNQDYRIIRPAKGHYDLHVEYEFPRISNQDCISFSSKNDTFFCVPQSKDVSSKLVIATQEMFKILNESKETETVK